jgi:predicted metal-binding protein
LKITVNISCRQYKILRYKYPAARKGECPTYSSASTEKEKEKEKKSFNHGFTFQITLLQSKIRISRCAG